LGGCTEQFFFLQTKSIMHGRHWDGAAKVCFIQPKIPTNIPLSRRQVMSNWVAIVLLHAAFCLGGYIEFLRSIELVQYWVKAIRNSRHESFWLVFEQRASKKGIMVSFRSSNTTETAGYSNLLKSSRSNQQ
jgi:hypothetical protein